MANVNVIDGHHATLEGEAAAGYHELADRYMRGDLESIARVAQSLCPPEPAVLDVGCGSGLLLRELRAVMKLRRCCGLDTSRTMLRLARGVLEVDGLDLRLWEEQAFPFEAELFDLVLSVWSLHHWRNPLQVFAEMVRTAKPGATLVLVDIVRDASRSELDQLTEGLPEFLKARALRLNDNYAWQTVLGLLPRDHFCVTRQWRERAQGAIVATIHR